MGVAVLLRSTAQTFAKVSVYADQRIGELLRELPKAKNQHDVSNLPTGKTQAVKDAGLTPKTAAQLEQLAANPEVVEAVIAKAEATETAQTFAKVGIYADQRIGEILRELPTRQGARNDITSVTTVTKVEAEKQAGVSHKTAIDLQAMAANPDVVEAVIAKAEKAKERMQDPMQTFAEGQTGTSRDKAAEQFGISGEQARKTLFVDDHRDMLDPTDFAEWDEGKLSTNKAFQRIKAAMAQAEKERQDLGLKSDEGSRADDVTAKALRQVTPHGGRLMGRLAASLRRTPSRKITLLAAVISISHGIIFAIRLRYVMRQGIMAEQSMTVLCRMHPTRDGSSRAIEVPTGEGGVGRWA